MDQNTGAGPGPRRKLVGKQNLIVTIFCLVSINFSDMHAKEIAKTVSEVYRDKKGVNCSVLVRRWAGIDFPGGGEHPGPRGTPGQAGKLSFSPDVADVILCFPYITMQNLTDESPKRFFAMLKACRDNSFYSQLTPPHASIFVVLCQPQVNTVMLDGYPDPLDFKQLLSEVGNEEGRLYKFRDKVRECTYAPSDSCAFEKIVRRFTKDDSIARHLKAYIYHAITAARDHASDFDRDRAGYMKELLDNHFQPVFLPPVHQPCSSRGFGSVVGDVVENWEFRRAAYIRKTK